jgi:K+-sensing histidine kinase KdpD
MPWVHRLSELSIKRQGLLSWAVALAIFTGSVAVRFPIAPFVGGLAAFTTFYPAIIVVTLVCGWQQGTLVLILSTLTGWYFFLEPRLALEDKKTIETLAVFLLIGGFDVLLVAALRETIRRVELFLSRNTYLGRLNSSGWAMPIGPSEEQASSLDQGELAKASPFVTRRHFLQHSPQCG